MDYAEKLQRCHEYVEALEEERRKIQVFQRELPLCLELVTQAIETCRRELSGTTVEYVHGQSECSEQTSSDGPVLAEFIPIKKRTNTCCDEEEKQSHKRNKSNSNNVKDKNNSDQNTKSDWLSSVQLWNQSQDPPSKEVVPRKAAVTEVRCGGGAFQPFHREKSVENKGCNKQSVVAKVTSPVPAPATSSTTETVTCGNTNGEKNKKDEKDDQQQSQRKQRRCWSPELHRRFLQALQQLGGSHAATPKQIRELMKVDGLTNDEVKSHLQKYRLHTRRPSPPVQNTGNPQTPQFVVVGGIWMQPPEYAAMAAATTVKTRTETEIVATATAGIYSPAPKHVSTSLIQKLQPSESEGRGSHSEGGGGGGVHSNSPATSSSTHTTTNSPALRV
ncbi:hypothetical protein K2173_017126 [Erythroxylum novogranatense]|uniref:HTH myb-type domain-containing protein n=1 Tax=Erythroxylum novogranatense TaxID=1862640 RepID=A0AAV8U8L8_9ROSI|nr:hypothetical protein K2173_017126 [Erythroxylum novogranatense]